MPLCSRVWGWFGGTPHHPCSQQCLIPLSALIFFCPCKATKKNPIFVLFPGWGNRLPYFINYFFDTYLLINEDTPVGKCCAPAGWACQPHAGQGFEK